MARPDKIQMPSSQGGLVRYFEDYHSNITLKPGHIIILVVVVILIEVLLQLQGMSMLGIK